jgi:hypothetical protein
MPANTQRKVRISYCSGIDAGKTGTIIPWSHPDTDKLAREYPFVDGRTPQSMKWVAVRLDSGEVITVPENRVQEISNKTEEMRRDQLLRKLAEEVGLEDLIRICNSFPHLISEARRELLGEVEYKMIEKKGDSRK